MTLQALTEAMADNVRVRYAWLRYLMTLATGVLALLATLQGNYAPRTDMAVWLLQCLWGTLGLSILFGAIALSGEVRLAQGRQSSLVEALTKRLEAGESTAPPFVMLPTGYRFVEGAFYVLLCGSLVLLVAFGIVNVPQP